MSSEQDRFRDSVLKGVEEALSVESKDRKLEVKNVSIPNPRNPWDLSRLKEARLKGGSFVDKVYADVAIIDKKTNKKIKSGRVHVADIPIKTPLGTYLVDGAHYQNANQAQLKGTAFTRIKNNGEVASDFRLERGWNFELGFNPDTEKFIVNVRNGGKYPLFPLLKAIGVSDEELRNKWGDDILSKNTVDEKNEIKVIKNFATKVFGRSRISGKTHEQLKEMVRNHFVKESKINPEASLLTLGKPYKTVTSNALLAATKKIIDVHKQEVEPDRRDEIYYKRFRDMADTGYEIIKESLPAVKQKIKRRIDKPNALELSRTHMRNIIGMDVINPVVKSIFTQSKLRGAGDTTNLLDILANESKVTITGEHGIGSAHKITEAARDLHPSSIGFIDPVMTPQGGAGTSEHLAIGSKIENGVIKKSLLNLRTGKKEVVIPEKLFGKTVVFPGELKKVNGKWVSSSWHKKVRAVKDGKIVTIDAKDGDYMVPSATEMYSEITNLIPFLNNNSGGRAIMATGQLTQAVPLKDPEPPLVRAQNFEASESFILGAKSPVDGEVISVTKNRIRVKDKNRKIYDVPLFDNLPLNRESFIDSKPIVKKGDKVKKGQVLADNNFTKDGVLSLGRNLVTAVMPWKGYNYEDGQVISESAAKKLSSEHLYDLSSKLGNNSMLSSGRFAAYRGSRYNIDRENEANTDPMTGLIKPGARVKKGDILARIVTKSTPDPEDNLLKIIKKNLVHPYKVTPIVWENENPGIVTHANVVGSKINLFVKSVEPIQVGDKLSDRHGHKGVVTKIIPDSEMPYIKETGEKVDLIIDAASIPSRVNVGQVLEMAASKIAKKVGKPYITNLEDTSNAVKKIKKQMTGLGIKDKVTIVDPVENKEIKNINAAPKYISKLEHQVEHKLISRNPDEGYDMDRQPVKGRAIDTLTFWAMVGHGAKKNLGEMSNLKSNYNPEWWAQFESGAPTVLPSDPPYVWKKFESQLKGMGVNIKREGDKLVLMPLTDKDVLKMSNGAITGVDHVRKKNFKPIPGGIFDPDLTGGYGADGQYWTHIKLPEPILNPMFARAASKVTKLPAKKLVDINKGRMEVNGLTGGQAVKSVLDQIDVKAELEKAKQDAKKLANSSSKASIAKMNDLNTRIRFLNGLAKFNMKPSEAYMMNYVPVMPPVYRAPVVLPDGKMTVPAANFLYKDVAHLALRSWNDAVTKKTKNEIRSSLFDSVAGLTGIGEPLSNADYPGFLKQISGKVTKAEARRGISRQAKHGFFQKKVFRKRQEVSSGAVISVEPKLNVDEIMIPETAAWNMYSPMIARRLSRRGIPKPEIKQHIKDRTQVARDALLKEMESRPVFMNRAPSWHKFNIMAAWPKLHSGNDLKVPNLPINTYMSGDFDGDTLSMHIPIMEDAVNEAKQLMPSKIFMKSGTGTIMLKPQGSALAGLYDLTGVDKAKQKNGPLWLNKTAFSGNSFVVGDEEFKNKDEFKRAFDTGRIKAHDIVKVKEGKNGPITVTTVGRQLVNNILPPEWNINEQLDSKKVEKLLTDIGKKKPGQLANVANELSRLGDYHATYMGLSIGVDDIDVDSSKPKEIIKDLVEKIDYLDSRWKSKAGGRGRVERERMKKEEFDKHLGRLDNAVIRSIPKDNSLRIMKDSGAKGNATQLRQIVGPPALFHSATSGEILIPVENSFAHGLTPAEYFIQQTGGRFGLIRRNVGVSEPGEIGKDLFGINASHSVTEEDCGTLNGIWRNVSDRDILDRYLAKDNAVAKRNDLITEAVLAAMKRRRIKKAFVRSPLTCEAKIGVCRYCYGLDVNGNLPRLGAPVGIEDAQGVVNLLSNLALKSWHQSGGKEVGELPFVRYKMLVDMPDNIPNKAVLARGSGVIQRIEMNAIGGVDVYINDVRHRLPAALGKAKWVKEGVRVKKGDQLTERGFKKPQEVLELQGIRKAQDYMVDEMAKIFKSDQPGTIRRKTVENLVASMTRLGRVVDPGDSDLLPFDISPTSKMEYFNKTRIQEVPLKDSIGYRLNKTYGIGLEEGRTVERSMLKDFRRRGIKKVEVKKKRVQFEPILKPMQFVPNYKNDWLSRLNQKYLKETLLSEPGFGGEANIHGPDPVPAYVYGAEFGKTKKPETY